jgi:2-polyprenyl-3-methyl-5-hydroxy-6-metoxy-1,4-benzoquinol methylase
LDIGAGHGLFSDAVKRNIPQYKRIDIVDVSKDSLKIAQTILGTDRINYIQSDINDFVLSSEPYGMIILGEILEHLDNPLETLRYVTTLLSRDGVLWLTVPTNAPAIDHVYLFRSKDEVIKLIEDAGLCIVGHFDCQANHLTHLIGAFCIKGQ